MPGRWRGQKSQQHSVSNRHQTYSFTPWKSPLFIPPLNRRKFDWLQLPTLSPLQSITWFYIPDAVLQKRLAWASFVLLINPCVLSANRVDLGFFVSYIFLFYPPPPGDSRGSMASEDIGQNSIQAQVQSMEREFMADQYNVRVWRGGGYMYIWYTCTLTRISLDRFAMIFQGKPVKTYVFEDCDKARVYGGGGGSW